MARAVRPTVTMSASTRDRRSRSSSSRSSSRVRRPVVGDADLERRLEGGLVALGERGELPHHAVLLELAVLDGRADVSAAGRAASSAPSQAPDLLVVGLDGGRAPSPSAPAPAARSASFMSAVNVRRSGTSRAITNPCSLWSTRMKKGTSRVCSRSRATTPFWASASRRWRSRPRSPSAPWRTCVAVKLVGAVHPVVPVEVRERRLLLVRAAPGARCGAVPRAPRKARRFTSRSRLLLRRRPWRRLGLARLVAAGGVRRGLNGGEPVPASSGEMPCSPANWSGDLARRGPKPWPSGPFCPRLPAAPPAPSPPR